jgi:hypothetical protein
LRAVKRFGFGEKDPLETFVHVFCGGGDTMRKHRA